MVPAWTKVTAVEKHIFLKIINEREFVTKEKHRCCGLGRRSGNSRPDKKDFLKKVFNLICLLFADMLTVCQASMRCYDLVSHVV